MQKFTKTTRTLAALLVSGTALTGVASAAEVSANFGVTSDYIWRGLTQNGGLTSASGGLDVDYGNGFAAGIWVGDVTAAGGNGTVATQELDYYASYSGESGSLSYELGYIGYTYDADDLDFSDIYVSVGSGPFSLTYYHLLDGGDTGVDDGEANYVSVDYETELSEMGLTLHYGSWMGDATDDQTDISATLSKGDFSISYITTEDHTGVDDENRMVVSWGVSF